MSEYEDIVQSGEAIFGLIGYFIGSMVVISITAALVFSGIGYMLVNIGWCITAHKVKNL